MQQIEGRHLGEGEATDLRHDRAWRPSRDPDAGQCPASHPIIENAKGSNVYTDEYSIYARLPGLGYTTRPSVMVEANTPGTAMGSARSTPWRASGRSCDPGGISQEKRPLYLGFFQFVHNARRRAKALLGSLIEALVT